MQYGLLKPLIGALFIVSASMTLAGCQALAIAALGVGASTGVSHTINGTAYRTFTVSESRLRLATFAALKHMAITLDSTEKTGTGDLIKASAPNRQIEIELESVTVGTTRMRTAAKNGSFLYDSATATEIIQQTEKLLKSV